MPGIASDITKLIETLEDGITPEITPIAQKTTYEPTNEDALTIFWYPTSEKISTHVAAYYKGERIDFYPEGVASNNFESTDLSVITQCITNKDVPSRHLKTSTIPHDLEDGIQCYNLYPSQLGVSEEKLLHAFKDVKNNKQPYNLYTNNCADQIINIFKQVGINTTNIAQTSISLTPNIDVSATLPANIRNFAKLNGYRIDPHDAPFNNDEKRVAEILLWINSPDEAYIRALEQTPMSIRADILPDAEEARKAAKENPEIFINRIKTIINENKELTHTTQAIFEQLDKQSPALKKKMIAAGLDKELSETRLGQQIIAAKIILDPESKIPEQIRQTYQKNPRIQELAATKLSLGTDNTYDREKLKKDMMSQFQVANILMGSSSRRLRSNYKPIDECQQDTTRDPKIDSLKQPKPEKIPYLKIPHGRE